MASYDMVLFTTCVAIPFFNKRICNMITHDALSNMVKVTLSQYTNWNIILVIINSFYKNDEFEIFITINSTTIFIIYHIFRLTQKERIQLIPNIPTWCSMLHIDIISFFAHILPFIVYVYDFYLNKYRTCIGLPYHNIGYDVALFNLIWALQCFQGFDPAAVYYQIAYVYEVWCLTLFSHVATGYVLLYACNHL